MASRRITQETFDDVVKENIDEFDMEPKDALLDAINQFGKQGVDLSNIDVSGGVGREEAIAAIAALVQISTEPTSLSPDRASPVLAEIEELCGERHELFKRNQNLLMTQGGVNALHALLDHDTNDHVLVAVCNLINLVSKANGKHGSFARVDRVPTLISVLASVSVFASSHSTVVEIRDFFEPGGSTKLVAIVSAQLEREQPSLDVLKRTFALAKTVSRSENNKG
jgi:hypothetical protein